MKNPHTELVKNLVVTLGQKPELGKYWQSNTGVGRALDADRVIRFGLVGAADVTGLLPSGIRVELECKTGKGVQDAAQKSFQFMIERHGGIYLVVRSIPETIAYLEHKCKIL